MMTNGAKKWVVEEQVLGVFREAFPEFPVGKIEHTDRPDFLVHREHAGVLGIEVTELDRLSPPDEASLREQQSIRCHIVELARKRHEETSAPPLYVTTHFADEVLSNKAIRPLVDWLVAFVASHAPTAGGVYEARHHTDELPAEVNHVTIYRLQEATRSFFTAPISTWVPPLELDDLRRAIRLKEGKLSKYKRAADEVWLLIGINSLSLSTTFRDVSAVLSISMESNFSRVFAVDVFGRKVTELSVVPPDQISP